MTDESFISLFTFTAIELIAQLNLISSYSLIHMAKLWSVRVAMIIIFIIVKKSLSPGITECALARPWQLPMACKLCVQHAVDPAVRGDAAGGHSRPARGRGGSRLPKLGDLRKFSSLKVPRHQQSFDLALSSKALALPAVVWTLLPEALRLFLGPGDSRLTPVSRLRGVLWHFLTFFYIITHFEIISEFIKIIII